VHVRPCSWLWEYSGEGNQVLASMGIISQNIGYGGALSKIEYFIFHFSRRKSNLLLDPIDSLFTDSQTTGMYCQLLVFVSFTCLPFLFLLG
jgi:hypothetical protein